MRKSTGIMLGAALLCGVAIPASAQDANPSCARLQKLTDDNRARFQPAWVKVAEDTLRAGQAPDCERLAVEADRAAKQLDAQAANAQGGQQPPAEQAQAQQPAQAEGQQAPGQQAQGQQAEGEQVQGEQTDQASNIVVQQPAPNITVEQAAPRVRVQQARPEVTVNQPQPEIIVNQPAPVVTVEIPQPEIIVRMPEPQVNVAQAQPQVEVIQPQPQVQVVQPEQPQVQVSQAEQPVVQMQGETQANVQVQRQGEPKVSFQRAEPQVRVTQGEGQPKVTIERMQGGEQQQAAAQGQQQPQAGTQGRVSEEQTASTGGQRVFSDADRRLLGTFDPNAKRGAAAAVPVSELVQHDVVNLQGEELGTIESVVRMQGRDFAMISHGGVLGFGEETVAIPLERFQMEGDRIVLQGLTEQELEQLPSMQTAQAEQIADDQTVQIIRQ